MIHFKNCLITASLLLGVTVSGLSQAAPVLVTNRGDLNANVFIDWGQLGPSLTSIPDGTSAISNNNAVSATIKKATGAEVRVQPDSWSGNFGPGDVLVWTGATPGLLELVFSSPVSGVGAQIQSDYYGAYTATLDLYDIADTLIGSFSLNGVASGDNDNSAIFLGARDSALSISRIVYGLPVATNGINDFAINRLSLLTEQSVPEPASLALFAIGLMDWRLGRGRAELG